MKKSLALAILFVWSASAGAVTIDMVTVGNPGNAADMRFMPVHLGSVGYTYQIGKFEVTALQYTEFLNAVAKDDPNGLYDTHMANSFGAQILRSGSSPNYSYGVAADWADRPVNYVSFWDAARFANWLHNGQPTGAEGVGTTEDGAYHDVGSQTLFGRNPGAKYFIPSEDEWYKAAYHKNDGVTGHYWGYPTMSDTAPLNMLPDPGNSANCYNGAYTIGSPYFRTVVGEFSLSGGPYGTFDQGGNVWEWDETAIDSTTRGLRGGSLGNESVVMHANNRAYHFAPTYADGGTGFRIASMAVPEPSTILLALTALAIIPRRRR